MTDVPCGTPWSADDDLRDMSDLPSDVVENVAHAPPPPTDEADVHGIQRKILVAHLDGVVADLGNALRRARAAREALGQ